MDREWRILHIPSAAMWLSDSFNESRFPLLEQLDRWSSEAKRGILKIDMRPIVKPIVMPGSILGPTLGSWDYVKEHLSIVEVEHTLNGNMVGEIVFITCWSPHVEEG